MPEFSIEFRYTPAAWTALVNAPADRTAAVAASIEEAGGRLCHLWFRVEDLSGLAVLEAPDTETATVVALLIEASGAFASVDLRHLVPAAGLPPLLDRARAALPGYARPGGA